MASALANHVSASSLSYDPISKGRNSAAFAELESEGGAEGGTEGGAAGWVASFDVCPS